LMPEFWANVHDSYIERFLHTLESKSLNKDRYVYGLAKNGYIFPVQIHVRVIIPIYFVN